MGRAKLTPMAMAVLELLHERPMHPYEMNQLLRERHVENRVNVKPGSLYHTVDRLLADGHIEVVETQREGRRPERTVYALTEQGRDAFVERAVTILRTLAAERPEYATGLASLNDLDKDVALAQLQDRVLLLEVEVAGHAAIRKRLADEQVPEIYWIDWKYTAASCEFELNWTKQLVADIQSGRLEWQHPKRHSHELELIKDDDDKAS
ncbi:PadR family transcriptional regulator [Amycolatopsis sp.]|uniref:PadR family transcriptional regulator n=1 Tax=Amycolatopsis sp. TaxID=37632 RepID=UPI002D8023C0|nr:PadR family transcriptional regulator [Amycolatopsis sp.]